LGTAVPPAQEFAMTVDLYFPQAIASSELEVLREIEQQRHFGRPEGIA